MSRREVSILQWILLLSCLAFFYPLFGFKVPFTGDILYSFHPWLTYTAQNLQSGHLPLWNPYTSCGEPFLANPQTMIFYPGAVMFWMFPFAAAWPMFALLHAALLFWAAALAVRWWNKTSARAMIALAASAVAWGGFTAIHWEFPSATATLPYVLLVLLFGVAGHWIGLALATALMWTAGYGQFAVYGLMWSGMGMIWMTAQKKQLKLPLFWTAAVLAGVALALPQILPSWEVTRQSMRAGIGATESQAHLLNPFFLIKFLLPEILDKSSLPYSTVIFDHMLWPIQRSWLTTFFIGTAPLLLGFAGLKNIRRPKTVFLLISIFIFMSLAMGWEPVFSVARRVVPGLRYMTHFSNAMGMVVIALALLLPQGFVSAKARWTLWSMAAVVATGIALSPAARAFVIDRLLNLQTLSPLQDAYVRRAALLALGALVLVAAGFASPVKWRAGVLLVLTLAEVWLYGHAIYPFTDASFFHQPVPLAQGLLGTPNRLAYSLHMIRSPVPLAGDTLEAGYQSARQIQHPSLHLPHRVPFTWGYEVFPLKNFTEFRRTIKPDQETGPQLDFIGGRHTLATKEMPAPYRLTAQRANGLLYVNDNALPRAIWVEKELIIADPEVRLEYIAAAWSPAEEVILEETPAAPSSEKKNVVDQPLTWKELPGRLTARGTNAREGWLVYSETFYPGWEAYVNGEKVKLWKANHAFQAVRTPAGDWDAVLIYRPKLFRWGVMGCLAVLTALLAGVFFFR